ncbi:G-type lectin S-receptor-like serine/threonine-protein kinase LECRK1 [Mercurialis annua]|uniref:G-type lectin S-receptor-like serine/threonine-protein kinase LECRK1 n=1 Tax=Mercurialis annua TaxID=3986 RepID=UPI00215EA771|nr:G-type lectin S-receptor-like serine/threonine-protein kinase LECRK1 [Mercurialis annua]
MASVSLIFFVLFLLHVVTGAQQERSSKIELGSTLFPASHPTSWFSASGQFAFGFYPEGAGFAVGVWLVGKHNITVVWTSNRNDEPVSENSTIVLTNDGYLLLRTGQGGDKRIATNADAASSASLQDSGNLVLFNKNNNVIWESFNHPTDTILGGQTLFSGGQLISSSEYIHSTGQFHLKMQDDGNLVLYPLHTGDTPADAYWYTETFGHGSEFDLFLNSSGRLLIINRTNQYAITQVADSSSSGKSDNSTIYRATLDTDGVFRMYSHKKDGNTGELKAAIEWAEPESPCQVKSFCGFNSFCTFNDNQPYCLCLPGSDFINVNQSSLGCARNYKAAGCRGGRENMLHFNITRMENLQWGDRPYSEEEMTIEECSTSCLEDCNCGAALFSRRKCMKQALPLRYVRRLQPGDREGPTTAFLKIGIKNVDGRNSTNSIPSNLPFVVIRNKKATAQILVLISSLVLFSFLALIVSGVYIHKFRLLRYKRLLDSGKDGLIDELTLRFFSYNELKVATNGFKQELGKGSFGSVYKGTLYKGKKLIAVKRLEKLVEEGQREFRAEMRAIGRTHHRNLVRLLGYCATESKRLLVYEYMSNGSLADRLFKSTTQPDWNERMRMALDVAKGILYLHEECESPIIHCDIKPQNILMDDFFRAKISDFGLAKLLMPDQTKTFTIIRGTRGYLAPEWHKNIPISVKADVYSYGIVVLEIVCCRRNMDTNVSNPEEILLTTWVYNCFINGELNKLVVGEEATDEKILEKMVQVALWCIQEEPPLRPSMKSVVLMLEGIADISNPPCPSNASM